MGKSSRQKRRTYQTPKRARTGANLVWYAAAFVLLVGGTLAVALSRSNSANSLGPQSGDHWHAALGVNDCGTWSPNWLTPTSASTGGPVRAGTDIYAGLHSHGDGIIHLEPGADETGSRATLGLYFRYAGWRLTANSLTFASGVDEKNGNPCGGKAGTLRWSVNGVERHGDPAAYVLHDRDAVELVFTSSTAALPPKTAIPSYRPLLRMLGDIP